MHLVGSFEFALSTTHELQSSHCVLNTPVPKEIDMCIYVNHNHCFVSTEVCQSGLPA